MPKHLGGGQQMLRTMLAAAVATTGLATTAYPQENTTTLAGVVVDTLYAPISDALVFIEITDLSTRTDANGTFQVGGIPPGKHLLSFRQLGFAPRTFEFQIGDVEGGQRDVGTVMLHPGLDPTASFSGTVADVLSGRPVVAVAVGLDGVVMTVTDDSGSFHASGMPVGWGPNQLQVRRIGYADETADLWVAQADETFDLAVGLVPLPIELAEIIVEGDRTIYAFGRLRGFYQRRRTENGHFFTRDEIERRATHNITDLFRSVPGVTVTPGQFANSIRFSRGSRCGAPMVYLDGMQIQIDGGSIDELVVPMHVAAVEVYTGPSQIPPQFNSFGACGVIVIWTR